MWSAFLCYRAATLALFIVFNAVICTVAAWNLSFSGGFPGVGSVDGFLIAVGASGLMVVFTVIFVEVFRRNAFMSRVGFEVGWLTLFWILNFAGAAALSAVVLGEMCRSGGNHGHKRASSHNGNNNNSSSSSSDDACRSARALVVFAWLNTVSTFLYFFLLVVFTIMHQKEDAGIWRASTREFPWFATKQCIRSTPNSPMGARFVNAASASLNFGGRLRSGLRSPSLLSFGRARSPQGMQAKPPSFAAPKPRRPPPVFVHQRAGLSSQVEIEHFSDVMSAESQIISPTSMDQHFQAQMQVQPLTQAKVQQQQRLLSQEQASQQYPANAAYALYSHALQTELGVSSSGGPPTRAPSYVIRPDNTYLSSELGDSPPPIRDWPRPLGGSSKGAGMSTPDSPRSARAMQKMRAPPAPPSRSNSEVSRTSSGKSRRAAPPPPTIALGRLSENEVSTRATQVRSPTVTSPSRTRPTGPRHRGGEAFIRPRPPPLDLTREGAVPVPQNRR